MRTSYDIAVAEPVESVWSTLTDVDTVLAAIPGAALARDGDAVGGSLKCKLGSTQITYRIGARAEVGEAKFHTAVIAVTGKEARGSGTIAATLTVALRDEGAHTRVEVSAEIEASGRGEAADESAWTRLLETLVTGVIPPPQEPPAAEPGRAPLSVAPSYPGTQTTPKQRGRLIVGGVGIVLVVLARRVAKRRR